MKCIYIVSKTMIFLSTCILPVAWFILIENQGMQQEIFGNSIYSHLWDISFLSVLYVMSIRPLSDLFPQYTILKKLIVLRKAFGILSAMIVVLALTTKWIQNPFTFSGYFHGDNWNSFYPIIARISEITALILLLTSNNFSIKKLGKNWKKVQRFSYMYFISGGIIAAQWENGIFIYSSIAIVIILHILVPIKKYLLSK